MHALILRLSLLFIFSRDTIVSLSTPNIRFNFCIYVLILFYWILKSWSVLFLLLRAVKVTYKCILKKNPKFQCPKVLNKKIQPTRCYCLYHIRTVLVLRTILTNNVLQSACFASQSLRLRLHNAEIPIYT